MSKSDQAEIPGILCSSDIVDLREKLACSFLDMYYILGRMPPQLPMTKGEKGQLPIKSLPVSYLARLIREAPELVAQLLPEWATHEEAYAAVSSVWDADTHGRLSGRKFAILCGVTPWTYAKWVSGENEPTTSTLRLFRFLCDIIKLKGRQGLDLYLQCIAEDAKSRGIAGLKGLFKTPDKKEKDNPETE